MDTEPDTEQVIKRVAVTVDVDVNVTAYIREYHDGDVAAALDHTENTIREAAVAQFELVGKWAAVLGSRCVEAYRPTAGRDLDALLAAAKKALRPSYDLVYVNQGDKFTDEQVAFIVKGDYESLWDSTGEWESDQRWDSITTIVTDVLKEVTDAWSREDDDEDGQDYDELIAMFDGSDQEALLRDEISERDSSDWVKELARGTSAKLLRIRVLSEDDALDEQTTPEQALEAVGLPNSERNRLVMATTLGNACTSVMLGYWIVGADVQALLDLPEDDDAELELVNPYLYLGNPFAGSGFVSEDPFQGVVTVKRGDLRTDKDAFGYSIDSIYGGVSASSFEVEIRVPASAPEAIPTT